ncbi:Cytoplasmic protein [Petrocella atlantisensis]|uniref:Cytoplasmic protein n=1 Tax=Petrocella atlantisensis TaxID=2173034 RepID=A0A3P7NZG9_9FIRM|nr:glutamine amidotransferase [Petrocella atlantisensis]PKM54997.1 MAG: cytoplasmic protein [Firmicutes bacterium HGW-Firmicutes-5]VDN48335.1 Cytoplasmic protein [Petrocella atlantisensis]
MQKKVIRILFIGESWSKQITEGKGFNYFSVGFYEEGIEYIIKALTTESYQVTHLPSHLVASNFPKNLEELSVYDAIILSDVGADSFLLTPETFIYSQRTVNLLNLIERYVNAGGGFCMIGGYMSFQGIGGKARYHKTIIEDILPVRLFPYDDREEIPEGFIPEVVDSSHEILHDIKGEWPYLLGYNRLVLKEDANLLLAHGGNPILAINSYGEGRTMAFASDCSPHWAPPEFCDWPYYKTFWQQAVGWLVGEKGRKNDIT